MHRSLFIKSIVASIATVYFTKCTPTNKYVVTEVDDNAKAGHLLREALPQHIEIAQSNSTDIVIIGGGVSALSAARYLQQNSKQTVSIIELGNKLGGNAVSGQNETSSYPWAAHYLPIADVSNIDLIQFLEEANIITHYDKQLPYYNDEYLCFDPKERLFIQGKWQEGIIPNNGMEQEDKKQIDRFHQFVKKLNQEKGLDGKYIFAIPINTASQKNDYIALDKISFANWLQQNNYTSKPLLWYLNYCCSDDYGSTIENTSAWAGLHYFSARRGEAANAKNGDVLTWPQGNAFLIDKLQQQTKATTYLNAVVLKVENIENKKRIIFFNTKLQLYYAVLANAIICATSIRVANKLFPNHFEATLLENIQHYPWVVANITIKPFQDNNGVAFSWDNVIYNSNSLGYVVATHQQVNTIKTKEVLTFYYPINNGTAKEMRKKVYKNNTSYWQNEIIKELKKAHPTIEENIIAIEIKKMGHGMIAPIPNFIFNPLLEKAKNSSDPKLTFAHTDFCGISIFEEAFAIGIAAAKKLNNA